MLRELVALVVVVVVVALAASASTAQRAISRTASRGFDFAEPKGIEAGSTDPDTDDPSGSATTRTWRYLFNRVGDLVAVRDPRGCGQNFFYDQAGRLIGEDYVRCAEAQEAGDEPADTIPETAIAFPGEIGNSRTVDVRYYFDEEDPGWSGFSTSYSGDVHGAGRLTAIADRAQRSRLAYDGRGNVLWQARQMALLATDNTSYGSLTGNPPGLVTGEDIASGTRAYDEDHTYVLEQGYDYQSRPVSKTLPADPDWSDTNPQPTMVGRVNYDRRGLPRRFYLSVDSAQYDIARSIEYNPDGQASIILHGDAPDVSSETREDVTYDARLRPIRHWVTRPKTGDLMSQTLDNVSLVMDERYTWDGASNLIEHEDLRHGNQWADGYRPVHTEVILHDSLYRVVGAEYLYRQDDNSWSATDPSFDWRAERTRVNGDSSTHEAADPMREEPAPMLPAAPDDRPVSLTWEYDWLANMVGWTDDASSFYERSIDRITNGFDASKRPSALYLASNLPTSNPGGGAGSGDRGGWLEVGYGKGGNVETMTVHAQCADSGGGSNRCWDDTNLSLENRLTKLREKCVCAEEQHYQYRWDELNRLSEARRYDRGGSGSWSPIVRQRYRYDAGNVRMVKETISEESSPPPDRSHLYVYPGHFERSGLEQDSVAGRYDASTTLGTETQYFVAGARIVWALENDPAVYNDPPQLDRQLRMTYRITNLIGSSSAVIDLYSGELLEATTYYPNGAVESQLTQDKTSVQLEPLGFTGKEADDEVGVVYFGERYLIPRIGRWASPDPLHVHAVGGGEALNSYHYVGGNILQARDPLGLDPILMDGAGNATDARSGTAVTGTDPSGAGAPSQAPETGPSISAAQHPLRDYRTPSAREARLLRDQRYEDGLMETHPGNGLGQSALDFVAGTENDLFQLGVAVGAAFTGISPEALGLDRDADLVGVLEDVGVETGVDRYSVEYGEFTKGPNLQDGFFAALGGAARLGTQGAGGSTGGAFIEPDKFNYFFGNVTTGRAHNIARSAQNAQQLGRIGVHDNAAGRGLLQSHFDEVVADPSNVARTFSNRHGSYEVRESLLQGPGGFLHVESTWEVMMDGTRRITSMIPRGGP